MKCCALIRVLPREEGWMPSYISYIPRVTPTMRSVTYISCLTWQDASGGFWEAGCSQPSDSCQSLPFHQPFSRRKNSCCPHEPLEPPATIGCCKGFQGCANTPLQRFGFRGTAIVTLGALRMEPAACPQTCTFVCLSC